MRAYLLPLLLLILLLLLQVVLHFRHEAVKLLCSCCSGGSLGRARGGRGLLEEICARETYVRNTVFCGATSVCEAKHTVWEVCMGAFGGRNDRCCHWWLRIVVAAAIPSQ